MRWSVHQQPNREDRSAVPHDEGGGERPAASTLVRISHRDRGPALIVALIAAFLAIALIKPWPPSGGPRASPRLVTPGPTQIASIDPLAAIRLDCQEPPGWRTFSRERWSNGSLRSWRSLEPTSVASGPLDPAIPLVPLVSRIEAVGFCAPWASPERPPEDVTVRAWRIEEARLAGETRQAELLALRSASATLHPPFGALYGPPVEAGSTPSGLWLPGTYVFAVQSSAYERWWAVRIDAPQEIDPSAAPVPSRSPAAASGPAARGTESPVP